MADGEVRSAYARVTLTSPIADPSEEPKVISLDIKPDGGGFRWSAYYEAEEGLLQRGRNQMGIGRRSGQAKRDSWGEVCQYLTNLGYTDDEITESISQPAGSLTLDLDEGDDDDE